MTSPRSRISSNRFSPYSLGVIKRCIPQLECTASQPGEKMSTSLALKSAAALFAVLLVALGTVQGTQAMWNQTVDTNAGVVQAADFAVNLLAPGSTTEVPMTAADGKPVSISLTGGAALGPLYPTQSRTTWIQMANATNSPNLVARLSVAGPPRDPAGGQLFGHMIIAAKVAPAASGCADEAGYQLLSQLLPSSNVEPGASTVFCFRVTLHRDTPATFQGSTVTIEVPFSASQIG